MSADPKSLRRAIIFAGGDLVKGGGERRLLGGPWEYVILADSGAKHALDLGMEPTVLLGDMDSIDPGVRSRLAKAPTLTFPEDKDKTDSQLAVEWALARGANYILIAGGIGSRLDHSLANAHLLYLIHRAGATGVVTDGRQSVYLLLDHLALEAPPGHSLSILPLTTTCRSLVLQGLRWEVSGADLVIGDTRFVSNEFTHKPASLSLASGMALVIVGSEVDLPPPSTAQSH